MSPRRLTTRHVVGTLVTGGLLVAFWCLAWPSQLGGPTTYVTTRGVSMAPGLDSGDLAILRSRSSYQVGDVAAYDSDRFDTVVLHRIIARDGEVYTFKGDSNSWVDPETPTADQLIGTMVLRVPQGGTWLRHLASPAVLGVGTFVVVAAGNTTVGGRRRTRRLGRRKGRRSH